MSTQQGRKYKRLEMTFDLEWTIESQKLSGKGKIADVSLLGASFIIDQLPTVERAVVFGLRAPDVAVLPPTGRLRWFRKASIFPLSVLIGVIFEGTVSSEWTEWVERATAESKAKKIA